ncbi:TIGR03118 family protein [Sorangium sp. So ce375]|uniref:TIGR03118 family protein n=1 Tax=Sorangium sp. So ce375 TaxID=3133306 RepID=UPI003F5C049D
MKASALVGGCALATLALSAADVGAADVGATESDLCFRQRNLVSNLTDVNAQFVDSNLKNSWGIQASAGELLWVADNGTGVVTVYQTNGQPVGSPQLIIDIPAGVARSMSAPTGLILNETTSFRVPGNFDLSALFLTCSEDGAVSAWNPFVDLTEARIVIDNSNAIKPAVYKGLAIGHSARTGRDFLYLANFVSGKVERYNGRYQFLDSFTDDCLFSTMDPCSPGVPASQNSQFAPFNVAVIKGHVYVSFAQRMPGTIDNAPLNGFIDEFSLTGRFIRRFASEGPLNAPWAMVKAPRRLGRFSETLLVGNFGDGHISSFDFDSGEFIDQLQRCTDGGSEPLVIDGLWGLTFQPAPGPNPSLFFASGPNDEANGLVGRLRQVR